MSIGNKVNIVDVGEWNKLVSNTYGRPYNFQQQEGCQERGVFKITIPSEYSQEEEDEMNESIPEVVNGEEMGVRFKTWLERDPNKPILNQTYDFQLGIFWDRNFYPNIHAVANDLYEKGLIDAGDYVIDIDW